MNKDDIKKALAYCASDSIADCKACPYADNGPFACSISMYKDALNLITEQEKEIERLKDENEELTKVISSKVYALIDNTKEIADAREAWEKQAKIEAVKEFADKLKTRFEEKEQHYICMYDWNGHSAVVDCANEVDELLKEIMK